MQEFKFYYDEQMMEVTEGCKDILIQITNRDTKIQEWIYLGMEDMKTLRNFLISLNLGD